MRTISVLTVGSALLAAVAGAAGPASADADPTSAADSPANQTSTTQAVSQSSSAAEAVPPIAAAPVPASSVQTTPLQTDPVQTGSVQTGPVQTGPVQAMPAPPVNPFPASPAAADLGTTTTVTPTTVTPATAAGPPAAPATANPGLPAPGSFVMNADGDMLLACNGTLHRVELHGTAQETIGGRIAGPDGAPGVVVTTTSENLLGYDPDLGAVTVSEAAPAQGELVAAAADKLYPAAGSIAQDVTVSFEHSPCDSSGSPMTFRSKNPFPLLDTDVAAFPPHNDVYTLLDQVELDSVDAPTPVTAQLEQFPVTFSHSPAS